MTVLVGILCQDGVVIGADSSATFSAGNFRTIEQNFPDKIRLVGNHLIHAGTGQVGLMQRFHALLEANCADGQEQRRNGDGIPIGKAIARMTVDDFRETGVAPGQFGALVAYAGKNKSFGLIEFGPDMQPEIKTSNLWFSSMGSGQPLVDPFLALLRRSLFSESQPRLNEGIFAVVWALQHAIELNTGGINGPMHVGVVAYDKSKTFIEARMISDEELSEHQQSVEAMTKHIGSYRDQLNGRSVAITSPPPPPSPPSNNGN